MITSQNVQNSAKYSALFTDAYNLLKKEGDLTEGELDLGGFTRLEEYFTRMQTLSAKHVGEVQNIVDIFDEKNNVYYAKYAKFLMLPLDETPFEINANSRQITVPDNFRKYGVSLHGDQIAETLLFRVDRFFDFQDLLNTTILVQWTRPGKEAESEREGVSLITLVDYETEPGKIWFGWPLTADITKEAGELKFSVRFLRKNSSSGNISYSLNTLTTQVTIKPALHPNLNNNLSMDEASILFSEAIVNSPSTGSTPAARPVYLQNLAQKAWLVNDALKLAVTVKTGDTGVLTYTWYKADITGVDADGKFIIADGVQLEAKTELRRTTDTTRAEDKAYYLDSEDGAGVPYLGEIKAGVDENNQPVGVSTDGAAVYERYSVYEMPATGDVTGQYWVIAQNRAGTSTEQTKSIYCEVPGPKTLVFTTENALVANKFINDDGSVTLVATATPDDPDPTHTTLTYLWEKKTEIDGTYTEVKNAEGAPVSTGNTLVLEKAAENEDAARKHIGWYRVTAQSVVNRDPMTCVSANDCKVTAHPTLPSVTFPLEEVTLVKGTDDDAATGVFTLNVELADKGGLLHSEYYTYTWFRSITDSDPVEVKADDADIVTAADVLEAHRNNSLQVKLAPNDEVEFYFCEVRNHLNGEVSNPTVTKLFRVSAQ